MVQEEWKDVKCGKCGYHIFSVETTRDEKLDLRIYRLTCQQCQEKFEIVIDYGA